jgi:hypothetical protein
VTTPIVEALRAASVRVWRNQYPAEYGGRLHWETVDRPSGSTAGVWLPAALMSKVEAAVEAADAFVAAHEKWLAFSPSQDTMSVEEYLALCEDTGAQHEAAFANAKSALAALVTP